LRGTTGVGDQDGVVTEEAQGLQTTSRQEQRDEIINHNNKNMREMYYQYKR